MAERGHDDQHLSRWFPRDVAELLASATAEDLREVARTAGSYAIERVALVDRRLAAAWKKLHAAEYGDSSERSEVEAFTAELDELAWDIQDQVNAGKRSTEDYTAAFSKARAANALWCALEVDPYKAASEAIYEAQHAVDDPEPLYQSVRALLAKRP